MAIRFEEFNKICRFCLKANIVLFHLFEGNVIKSSTKSAFEYLGHIFNNSPELEILAGDGLPQSICENCTNKLMVCRDFWNQCHSAALLLKTVLAEHLKKDTGMNQDRDGAVSVVNQKTIKTENIATLETVTEMNAEHKPNKRIRKKPEYQHCSICGLRCRYLNRHIAIMHSNETKFECDICKKYYARSKGQLYIHMGAKHINKFGAEFVCKVCDRYFKSLKKLNNHKTLKHPARRHPCPHCHLIFKSERTLNRHQTIHTGERNFICEECGKAFRQTETLRNHQLRHSPPTVPCPHCDKMFYVKSQLRNHEGIHTGLRPWKCDICSASFVASSGLTVHRNKHKRENIFPSCKLCGEQFNERLDLRMHMNDHRKSLI